MSDIPTEQEPAIEPRRITFGDRIKLLLGPMFAGAILHLGIQHAAERSMWAVADLAFVGILLARSWNLSGILFKA